MTRLKTTKLSLTGAASLLALSLAAGNAYAEQQQFDIEAQSLAKALLEFNEQSGLTVAAPRELVADKQAPAVRGEMEPEEALEKILSGSGLQSNELSTGAYTITLASAEVTEPAPQPFRVAQLDQEEDVREIDDRGENDDEARQDVIVVTGTNIRNAEVASPTTVIGREEIELSGVTGVSELLENVTQNFGGGANPDTGAVASSENAEVFGTNTINLRGLGAEATLVLFNGRRLSTSGSRSVVDVSMIPVSALERVEILTDGASATYGSDAIAGVVNFVLRRDFEGAETSAGYATANGDRNEYLFSQAAGVSFGKTNLFGSYQFRHQEDLEAIDRDFTIDSAFEGAANREELDILPRLEAHNVLVAATHTPTENIQVFADFIYNHRTSRFDSVFRPPSDLRPTIRDSEAEQISASITGVYNLSEAIDFELAGVYSRSDLNGKVQRLDVEPVDGDDFKNELFSIDAKISGDLIELPAGPLKFAVGYQHRNEEYENPGDFGASGERDVNSFFAETAVPILGSENSIPGFQKLSLSLAVRVEDYTDVGSTTNPKVGVIWEPVSSLRLTGTWGTSFRAPNLAQLDPTASSRNAVLFNFPDSNAPDGVTTGFIVIGRNAELLEPETSEAFTIGLDYSPHFLEGLTVGVDYFNVAFDDRIARPTSNLLGAFENRDPFLDLINFDPTVAEVNAFVATLPDGFINGTGMAFDPASVEAIFENSTQNLSSTDVSGLDFNAIYSTDAPVGQLDFSLTGSYLFEFENQVTARSPVDDTLNTIFNPIDLRLRGGVSWQNGGLRIGGFVQHQTSYTNTENIPPSSIDPWTRLDLSLSYDFGDDRSSVLNGTRASISVQNVFNTDPPSIGLPETFQSIGLSRPVDYDPANGSPIGRYISFRLTKQW